MTRGQTPEGYDPRGFPPVAVTVDMVVLTIDADALSVVLVVRGGEPFKGRLALPGGFVLPDETLDQAAARELVEETGVEAAAHLEQFGAYGDPKRDPRMRIVTVAYLAVMPDVGVLRAGTDATRAQLVPVADVLGPRPRRRLAFDHRRILADGVERARAKLEYSPLATSFCAEEFTIAELRRVYEVVWGVELDPRNFHRKVTSADGFLEPTGSTTTRDGGRPAQVFRPGHATALHPPMLRPT